jgi:hypothetical protein
MSLPTLDEAWAGLRRQPLDRAPVQRLVDLATGIVARLAPELHEGWGDIAHDAVLALLREIHVREEDREAAGLLLEAIETRVALAQDVGPSATEIIRQGTRRGGRARRELRALVLEVIDHVGQLSEEERQAVLALVETEDRASAAAALGISRGVLCARLGTAARSLAHLMTTPATRG